MTVVPSDIDLLRRRKQHPKQGAALSTGANKYEPNMSPIQARRMHTARAVMGAVMA
jgi:hypothetical protein